MAGYKTSLTNHDAEVYAKHGSFSYDPKFSSPVLELLQARKGERVIDLGCGTGEITFQIAQALGPKGKVYGVDSSESMLRQAQINAGSQSVKVDFIRADIQHLETSLPSNLKGTFDAVFTNATLHWCKASPGGVLEGVKWLLKPGGRMVFEFGGFGNTIGTRSAIHDVLRSNGVDPIPLDPWYFPTANQYTQLLQQHGLIPQAVKLFPRPTPLPTDMYGWLETFARKTFFADFSDEEADEFMGIVQEMTRVDHYWSEASPGMGRASAEGFEQIDGWEMMYVRIRGVATVPGSPSGI